MTARRAAQCAVRTHECFGGSWVISLCDLGKRSATSLTLFCKRASDCICIACIDEYQSDQSPARASRLGLLEEHETFGKQVTSGPLPSRRFAKISFTIAINLRLFAMRRENHSARRQVITLAVPREAHRRGDNIANVNRSRRPCPHCENVSALAMRVALHCGVPRSSRSQREETLTTRSASCTIEAGVARPAPSLFEAGRSIIRFPEVTSLPVSLPPPTPLTHHAPTPQHLCAASKFAFERRCGNRCRRRLQAAGRRRTRARFDRLVMRNVWRTILKRTLGRAARDRTNSSCRSHTYNLTFWCTLAFFPAP